MAKSDKPKEYSFSERIEWMMKARKLLDDAFYPNFAYQGRWVYMGCSPGSDWMQRKEHIDVVIQVEGSGRAVVLQAGPQSLTVDEKIDSKNRSTIFCETMSDKDRRKPGWMVKGVSKADVLLWAFNRQQPAGLEVHMFWLKLLIDWFWPRASQFVEYPISNNENGRRWTTLGRQVPIHYLPDEIFIVRKHLVPMQMELPLFG